MVKKIFFAIATVIASVSLFSCVEDEDNALRLSKSKSVVDTLYLGYIHESGLVHQWDSSKILVSDQMRAMLSVWRTKNEEKGDLLYHQTANPEFSAAGLVSKAQYNVTEGMLHAQVTSMYFSEGEKRDVSMSTKLDTLYTHFSDGQCHYVPMSVDEFTAQVDGKEFHHGTLMIVDARFESYRDTPVSTRADGDTYVAGVYSREYKSLITLKEKNVYGENITPKTFTVPVYAYATLRVLKDDAIVKTEALNKNRKVMNDSIELCSFDKIITYESGDVVKEPVEIELKRNFKGIDTYEKQVSNFDYRFANSNGITRGGDMFSRTEGSWRVNGRTDRYSGNISNGVTAEKIVTDYSFYHEKAVWTDGKLTVEFGYEDVAVNEIETMVINQQSQDQSKDKALETNKIRTTYLGYVQNLEESVILSKTSNAVSGYEIANQKLTVYNDSVVATLDFITKHYNGSKDVEHEHFKASKSLSCTTNWSSTQLTATQTTDSNVNVSMVSSNQKKQGFFTFVEQTRRLDNAAHLADGSSKSNSWTSVVPNNIVYTREGKTYDFGNLAFNVSHVGAKVTSAGATTGGDLYNYTDEIKVSYQNNVQNITAPGKIIVNGNQVKGYEFRDKKLVIFDSYVRASGTFVTIFMNGNESKDPVSKEFVRNLKVDTNWSATETESAEQTTGNPQATKTGSQAKSEGEWSYVVETRSITSVATLKSSKQNNGWTSTDPNNIVFTRNGVRTEFGTINFNVANVNAVTTLRSKSGLLETYDYAHTISVSYGDNTKSSTAPGVITLQKAKKTTGYDIRNPKMTVNENDVTCSLTWVTLFNDGTETTDPVTKSFPRTLNPYTNWTFETSNGNESTGAATVASLSPKNMTEGNWSYVREERDIKTTVTLTGGSKDNGWKSVDPNKIVYTREGKTYSFGEISFNAQEAGHKAVLGSTSATLDVYNYTDKLTVTYGSNTKSSTATGKINVKKEVVVSGYEIANPKLTVQQNSVIATLDFITKKSDGSSTTDKVQKSFARSFTVTTNWTANEKNNNQTTGAANVTLSGSANKTDGEWSYVSETRNISTTATLAGSTQNNGWKSIDPNKISFTRNGKTYTFETLNFNAQETGATITKTSEDATKTVYSYKDNITVTFGSNSFNSQAPGVINVKKEIVVSGYEIANPKLTVQQNSVIATLDFITKKSDGTSTTDKVQKSFARSFTVTTNWTANEVNNNQTTGAANVTLSGSANKTDGEWSYVSETRSISTTATLAGSTQNNGWKSVDPNRITFTRNGKTYTFETLSFNAQEKGATVTKTSEDATKTVYSYKDNITVTFGSNSFNSQAPGQIIVEAPWNPDFPKAWGKFVDFKVTVAPNETRKDWIYTWSIHFEKGTLPVVVSKTGTPTIEKSYFTNEVDSRLNGGFYKKNQSKWINTIASDEADWMLWLDVNGNNAGNMTYSLATTWKWDNGKTRNGHPSVFTDRFTYKISSDKLVLTVYFEGKEIASYKAGK